MCIACAPEIDTAREDAFAGTLLEVLNHSALALMISIGHRTGLFDTLADGAPRTSETLASDAGLNERYVREWLGAMTTARVVEHDPAAATFRLPAEHAVWLSRASAKDNLAVFAQYTSILGAVEDEVVQCFRNGGGVPYESYPRFDEVMAEDSGQSIVPIVANELLALMPGLHERLREGIEVLDVGCGCGRALNRLAREYPNSCFTGYDFARSAIETARTEARTAGLKNVRFEARDIAHVYDRDRFHLITSLDVIHDLARPKVVLRRINEALHPDGWFLMQDIDASSDVGGNLDHPAGTLLYTVSTMRCMTVSLGEGGMGLGTMWGRERAIEMLEEAGFESVDVHTFEHDPMNCYYLVRNEPAPRPKRRA